MATRTDITTGFYVRSAITLRIPVVDASDDPQTMTGWTLQFSVRVKRTGGQGTSLFTVATPTITLANGDGTNDVALVPITLAQSSLLSERITYEYSLTRTDGDDVLLKWGDLRPIAASAIV